MGSLAVLDVVRADPELLRGCWIDWPVPGSHVSSQAFDVSGWALGRNHDVVAVELAHGGVVLRGVPIDVSRPDVAAAYPQVAGAVLSGFRARASVPTATTGVELSVQVVLTDQTRVPIGLIRTQVSSPAPAFPADRPLVSVVIIFLNAIRFMEEAIESVFAQSYDRWELLLVDDGSTDGSTDLARRYAAQHPDRVRYVEHEGHQNRGMSASRNQGISQSRGEYIGFLDADDVWLPDKLALQLFVFYAHPEVGMVKGGTELWYSWAGSEDDTSCDDIPVPPTATVETTIEPPTLLDPFLQNKIGAFVGSVLLRRDSVVRVGGFNDAFRGPYEDQVFITKVFLNERVYVVPDLVCRYRQHLESVTATAWRTGVYQNEPTRAEEKLLRWQERYLSGNELATSGARKTLCRRLWPYRQPLLYRLTRARHRLKSRMEDLLDSVRDRLDHFKRLLLGRPTGTISAVPNPLPIADRPGYGLTGATELRWTSRGTSKVEVHIGGPEGRVFSRSGPCGSAHTGKWALEGMVFYLQDASEGRPRSPADFLARVKIHTSIAREPSR